MWDYFSQNLTQIITRAQMEAQKLGTDYIGSEHLALGIIAHHHNTACRTLKALGVDIPELEEKITARINSNSHKPGINFQLSARTRRILEISHAVARSLERRVIGSEHVLLGLLREGGGMPAKLLKRNFNITFETALEELYGITELKIRNFQEYCKAVESLLEKMEETYQRSLVDQSVFRRRLDEAGYLLDYLGDLLEGLDQPNLVKETLKIKHQLIGQLKKNDETGGKSEDQEEAKKIGIDSGRIDECEDEKHEDAPKENSSYFPSNPVTFQVTMEKEELKEIIREVLGERELD